MNRQRLPEQTSTEVHNYNRETRDLLSETQIPLTRNAETLNQIGEQRMVRYFDGQNLWLCTKVNGKRFRIPWEEF